MPVFGETGFTLGDSKAERWRFTRKSSKPEGRHFPRGKSQSYEFTRVNFRPLLVGLVLLVALPVVAQAQDPAAADSVETESAKPPERDWILGVSGGIPQIVALTVERRVQPYVHVQANAGSLLLINSLNARVLLMPEGQSFYPYLFAGGGYFFTLFDFESADNSAFYSWLGGGVRLRIKRLLLFFEISSVDELDDDATEFSSFGTSAGVLFAF